MISTIYVCTRGGEGGGGLLRDVERQGRRAAEVDAQDWGLHRDLGREGVEELLVFLVFFGDGLVELELVVVVACVRVLFVLMFVLSVAGEYDVELIIAYEFQETIC